MFAPLWDDPETRSLAATFHDPDGKFALHAMFNAHWEARDFELPGRSDGQPRRWRRWLDTALEPPNDISRWDEAPHAAERLCRVEPRSTVFLFSAAA